MKGRRSKQPDLVDLGFVRESSKFEGGTNSERKEIVKEMDENFPRRNRNVIQDQNL